MLQVACAYLFPCYSVTSLGGTQHLCHPVMRWLVLSTGHKLESFSKRETSNDKMIPHRLALWASSWCVFLIDVGEPSSLCMVSAPGQVVLEYIKSTGQWVIQRVSQQAAVALWFLSVGFSPEFLSGFSQWWAMTWKYKPKHLLLALVRVFYHGDIMKLEQYSNLGSIPLWSTLHSEAKVLVLGILLEIFYAHVLSECFYYPYHIFWIY